MTGGNTLKSVTKKGGEKITKETEKKWKHMESLIIIYV